MNKAMKKQVLGFAVMMMSACFFTACNSDSESHGSYPVIVNNGLYVVCSGNTSSGINGSLGYFDYTTEQSYIDIYKTANGSSLGMTVNDAVRYGSKFYIVVDGEHTVFVTDAATQKLITRIDMTAPTMLGTEGGVSPRRITADGGLIYVSTYGGYVAAIDTVAYSLQQKYKAGSYPEGIAIANGYLYVANSDYGYGNASISQINLTTGIETPIKNENIRNPQTIAVAGTTLYYLDYGQYGPAPTYAQEHAGVYRLYGSDATCVVPNATGMGAAGYYIYTYNAPYGTTTPTYSVYDIQSGKLTMLQPADIESPAAIEVDPISGDVAIASYHMTTSEWGTYPDYSGNGYVNIYDATLTTKKSTFDCGVGPTRIVTNLGVRYIEY